LTCIFSVVAYSVALGLLMSVGRQVTGKIPNGKVIISMFWFASMF